LTKGRESRRVDDRRKHGWSRWWRGCCEGGVLSQGSEGLWLEGTDDRRAAKGEGEMAVAEVFMELVAHLLRRARGIAVKAEGITADVKELVGQETPDDGPGWEWLIPENGLEVKLMVENQAGGFKSAGIVEKVVGRVVDAARERNGCELETVEHGAGEDSG